MDEKCDLRTRLGAEAFCDGDPCPYWRCVEHLGIKGPASGCALRHFALLGEDGAPVAEWLLSVRERMMSAPCERGEGQR